MATTLRRSPGALTAAVRLAGLGNYAAAFALRAVCTLGIADHLADGPREVGELAGATGTHPPSLLRALRTLTAQGILAEPAPGRFELTDLGDLLRSDHPDSVREALRLVPGDVRAMGALDHSVRTGRSGAGDRDGEAYFRDLGSRPEERRAFDAEQAALTRVEAPGMLSYDWPERALVVDVGGGDGTFLSMLLARRPSMRGIVFDLPPTAASAAGVLAAAGVSDRCAVAAGSFFAASPPAGADVYLLKRVLTWFGDDQAATVLASVREAMGRASRLLVAEAAPEPAGHAASLDLLALVRSGGRVRSVDEIRDLLADARLTSGRALGRPGIAILEATPT
jgi:hypothetical protein